MAQSVEEQVRQLEALGNQQEQPPVPVVPPEQFAQRDRAWPEERMATQAREAASAAWKVLKFMAFMIWMFLRLFIYYPLGTLIGVYALATVVQLYLPTEVLTLATMWKMNGKFWAMLVKEQPPPPPPQEEKPQVVVVVQQAQEKIAATAVKASSLWADISDWTLKEFVGVTEYIWTALSYFQRYSWVETLLLAFGAAAMIILLIWVVKKVMYNLCTKFFHKLYRFTQRAVDTVYTGVERVMPGSEFWSEPLPGFQVEIHLASANTGFYFAGNGFVVRVGNMTFLCTAAHVVDSCEQIRIKTARAVLEVKREDFYHSLLSTDISVMPIKDEQKAKLGLSNANLRKSAATIRPVNVKIASQGKVSTGDLSLADNDIGKVKYSGSTKRGFSGAPYFMNNTVYGMHTGCGTFNQGYDAAYIIHIIKAASQKVVEGEEEVLLPGLVFEQKEDSDEWIENQLMSNMPHRIARTGHGDEYEILIRGQYLRVDDDTMARFVNKATQQGKRLNILEYEFECFKQESMPPVRAYEADEDVVPLEAYKALQKKCAYLESLNVDYSDYVEIEQYERLRRTYAALDRQNALLVAQLESCRRPWQNESAPFPAQNLPTMPAASVNYNDSAAEVPSGNGLGPNVSVGANGQGAQKEDVRNPSGSSQNSRVSRYQTDKIWDSNGQGSTRAQQSNRSECITNGSSKPAKDQAQMSTNNQ